VTNAYARKESGRGRGREIATSGARVDHSFDLWPRNTVLSASLPTTKRPFTARRREEDDDDDDEEEEEKKNPKIFCVFFLNRKK
jgi:hypothetical protein